MRAVSPIDKKALYAIADKVPVGCRNITPGKHYLVLYDYGAGFAFEDDGGQKIQSLWQDSYQLRGGDWRRSKATAPAAIDPDRATVAWLYTRTVGDHTEVRADHVRWTSWLAEGWVETPLVKKPRCDAASRAVAA